MVGFPLVSDHCNPASTHEACRLQLCSTAPCTPLARARGATEHRRHHARMQIAVPSAHRHMPASLAAQFWLFAGGEAGRVLACEAARSWEGELGDIIPSHDGEQAGSPLVSAAAGQTSGRGKDRETACERQREGEELCCVRTGQRERERDRSWRDGISVLILTRAGGGRRCA